MIATDLDHSLKTRLASIQPALVVLDEIETKIAALPAVDMPVKHQFIHDDEGRVVMYVRAILMKSGTILTSQIHLTEHPYIVLCGKAKVWTPDAGWSIIQGPSVGVTKPGTKRLLEIIDDCIWLTFHVTNKETVEEVAREILLQHKNPSVDESRMVDLKRGEYLP